MKKISSIALALVMIFTGFTESGCFGSFTLTKKVYKFHNETFKNKIIKNLVFWIAGHAVYGFTGTVDIFILNVIEFWSGKNPLAMVEGEFDIQIVTGKDGKPYQIKASKNRFEVTVMSGDQKGMMASLSFNPENLKWTASAKGITIEVAEMLASKGEYRGIKYLNPKGEDQVVYFDANDQQAWTGLFAAGQNLMASSN